MSLFRRERVYASIEFDRVALVRIAADGKVTDEAVIGCALDPERSDTDWHTIARALSLPPWQGSRRSVVLSDRLVRYLVIERPKAVRSAAELQLACEARFRASLDWSAAEWTIEVDAKPFARRYVACALPRQLLEGARKAFSLDGELISLRPFLVCELQRVQRRLPPDCWFLAVASDSLSIAGFVEGSCRTLRMLPMPQVSLNAIEETLARETILTADVRTDAPVLLTGLVPNDPVPPRMRRIDGPSWREKPVQWSIPYRLALSELWV